MTFKPDTVPCAAGHAGNFWRAAVRPWRHGRRCRICRRIGMRAARRAPDATHPRERPGVSPLITHPPRSEDPSTKEAGSGTA